MFRTIVLGSALALGAVFSSLPAQGVSLGIGRGGIDLRIGGDHRPPPACPPEHGHWEIRRERVWIEGCERIVEVPARYAWSRDACGRMVRVCVRPAYHRVVREPGRWDWVERRVFVPHRGSAGWPGRDGDDRRPRRGPTGVLRPAPGR
jgi:hypothetical protein